MDSNFSRFVFSDHRADLDNCFDKLTQCQFNDVENQLLYQTSCALNASNLKDDFCFDVYISRSDIPGHFYGTRVIFGKPEATYSSTIRSDFCEESCFNRNFLIYGRDSCSKPSIYEFKCYFVIRSIKEILDFDRHVLFELFEDIYESFINNSGYPIIKDGQIQW